MYEEKHYGTWETLTVPERKEDQVGVFNEKKEAGRRRSGSHTHS
jgi:hypothetical protein